MSIFQQVLARAEAETQRKWAALRPLPRRALRDSVGLSRVTVKIHGQTLHLVRDTEAKAADLARQGWYRGMQVAEYRRFGKDMKRCAKCALFKRRAEFSPSKQNRDGRHSYCKKCRREAERLAVRQGRRKRKRH